MGAKLGIKSLDVSRQNRGSEKTAAFRLRKPLGMGKMERIFRSTPSRVQTAYTEWLLGV